MEIADFLKLGAFCVKRMSLKAQKDLLYLAETGRPFSRLILSELQEIENGKDFIKASGGRLDVSAFMDILTHCDLPTIDRIIVTNELKSLLLHSKEIEGYNIRANAAIYYTNDMDATLRWFDKILEWPGVIEARDKSGNGTYGLIEPHKKTYTPGNSSPYLQLMRGEPSRTVTAFMLVWGLNNLRQRAIDNGWTKVTPIEEQFWGANLFDMTTCDGSIIRFCEPLALG
jgi:hypothetical protein